MLKSDARTKTAVPKEGLWLKGHAHSKNTTLRMSKEAIEFFAKTARVHVLYDNGVIRLEPAAASGGKALNRKNRSVTSTAACEVIGSELWFGRIVDNGITFKRRLKS